MDQIYKKQKRLERMISAKVIEEDFQILKAEQINISKVVRDAITKAAQSFSKPKRRAAK